MIVSLIQSGLNREKIDLPAKEGILSADGFWIQTPTLSWDSNLLA